MENTPQTFIDHAIRQSWHKISRMYNQRATEYDLSISIGFILLIIDREGTPSTQLGPRMGMEPTSLSRTLKIMEERKLIYRKTDKEDKRKVLIFLTEEGVSHRKLSKTIIEEFNKKLLAKIPAGKLKIFFEVMEKVDLTVDEELKNTI